VVVPQPPGGGFDVVGRLLADRLGKAMGQSAVVENRPGSGTLVGTDLVAKAPADGYTLLVGSVSNLALNPGLYPNIPYDSLRDFEPVGLAVAYSYTLVARKDLPFANLRELIAYAKANPKKLTYASGGSGSGQHVLAAALWNLAGVEAVHVPYRGAPEIITAVMGGSALFGFPTLSTAVSLVKSGKLRALGVTGPKRNPAMPGVPPVGETVAGFEVVSWFGILAPAKFPGDVARRIDQEVQKALADPAFRDKVQSDGTEIVGLGQAAFPDYLRQDLQKWKRAVELSGAKVD
jgi:tripartite-type tricarboxylate transporter receptor subunit TctC